MPVFGSPAIDFQGMANAIPQSNFVPQQQFNPNMMMAMLKLMQERNTVGQLPVANAQQSADLQHQLGENQMLGPQYAQAIQGLQKSHFENQYLSPEDYHQKLIGDLNNQLSGIEKTYGAPLSQLAAPIHTESYPDLMTGKPMDYKVGYDPDTQMVHIPPSPVADPMLPGAFKWAPPKQVYLPMAAHEGIKNLIAQQVGFGGNGSFLGQPGVASPQMSNAGYQPMQQSQSSSSLVWNPQANAYTLPSHLQASMAASAAAQIPRSNLSPSDQMGQYAQGLQQEQQALLQRKAAAMAPVSSSAPASYSVPSDNAWNPVMQNRALTPDLTSQPTAGQNVHNFFTQTLPQAGNVIGNVGANAFMGIGNAVRSVPNFLSQAITGQANTPFPLMQNNSQLPNPGPSYYYGGGY